jgi:hypothetical protein
MARLATRANNWDSLFSGAFAAPLVLDFHVEDVFLVGL